MSSRPKHTASTLNLPFPKPATVPMRKVTPEEIAERLKLREAFVEAEKSQEVLRAAMRRLGVRVPTPKSFPPGHLYDTEITEGNILAYQLDSTQYIMVRVTGIWTKVIRGPEGPMTVYSYDIERIDAQGDLFGSKALSRAKPCEELFPLARVNVVPYPKDRAPLETS